MRLAIVVSHPIQYYAPIFRALAARCELHVFYGTRLTPQQQAIAGFGTAFDWDVDLLSGYQSTFMRNVSSTPGIAHFRACDTPEIGHRLREGRFDALLVIGWYLKVYVQAIVAAKRMALPVLVRGDSHLGMQRSLLKQHIKGLTYPMLLRHFDGALYVGTKSRAFYDHYRYPTKRLFYSPHCVDNDWFAARATPQARAELRATCGISDDAFVLLFAGKLVPFKQPLDVIVAAANARTSGRKIEVMVAGSGALEDDMRRRAAELGVPLHILGFRNQSEMPAAYAASDSLMLPSNGEETWGLVANEALACGRPIIISDACGCAPDLAADGRVGRVTPFGNVTALAHATASIMDRPPSAADIKLRSSTHSISRAVEGVLEAVEEVCRSQSRGQGSLHAV